MPTDWDKLKEIASNHDAKDADPAISFHSDGSLVDAVATRIGAWPALEATWNRGYILIDNPDVSSFKVVPHDDQFLITGTAGGKPINIAIPQDGDHLDRVVMEATEDGKLKVSVFDIDKQFADSKTMQYFAETQEFLNDPQQDHSLHATIWVGDGTTYQI
jgi:hypothetical protein